MEGQPVFVHAGPFANIAVGQSSIIADRVGPEAVRLPRDGERIRRGHRLREVLERQVPLSGLSRNVSVLTTTIRALKMHGGGPPVPPGQPAPEEYTKREPAPPGRRPPTCCTTSASSQVRDQAGGLHQPVPHGHRRRRCAGPPRRPRRRAPVAVSEHWATAATGPWSLPTRLSTPARKRSNFKFLYPIEMPLRERVEDDRQGRLRRRRRGLGA